VSLDERVELSTDWASVRSKLLWAFGLKEIMQTSHAFNDDNHCDAAMMREAVFDEDNSNGDCSGISRRNLLGPHIVAARVPELGPGGTWSTCTNGGHTVPPKDVAHIQFDCRIAFKLAWAPPNYATFYLLGDEGEILKEGTPTGKYALAVVNG